MTGSTHRRRGVSAAAVAGAIIAATVLAPAAVGTRGRATGHVTSGADWIGLTPRSTSKLLYEAGTYTDKLLGSGAVTFTIAPLPRTNGTILAKAKKVMVWSANGSLSGTGSGVVTITNKPHPGDATVTDGKIALTKGTGDQRGHSFMGTFTGNGNINSGQYVFHYKAIYR